MSKILISILITIIIVGSGAFYLGMQYGQGKRLQNLSNLTPEERQQRTQGFGANASQAFRNKNGLTAGEILAKDDKSITVKLPDGGSQIVFFSDSTNITKPSQGSLGDLALGTQVFVNGSQNSDGSITAQTIQLR